MDAPDWTPKAGDIVMDGAPRYQKWRATVMVVSRATASTMWLVGEKGPVRRGKYGWKGWCLATQDVIDAVGARKAWLLSIPKTTHVVMSRRWGDHQKSTPCRVDLRTANAETPQTLAEIADEARALADWLAAEPKESP